MTAVKTDTKAVPAHQGISLLLIEKGTPGVVSRKLEKIGGHSSDTAEIFFEDVKVPVGNLLGAEGQGFYAIMKNFALERLIAGVLCVEIAQVMLEKTIDYARSRVAFNKPIIKFQVVRHKIVDMATAVEMNRAFGYQCVKNYLAGVDVTKEISMFKATAAEMVNRAAYDATQVTGRVRVYGRVRGGAALPRSQVRVDRRRHHRDHEGDRRKADGALDRRGKAQAFPGGRRKGRNESRPAAPPSRMTLPHGIESCVRASQTR